MVLRFSTSTLVVSFLLVAAGCKDRDIAAYRIPKEPVPAPPAAKLAAPSSEALPDGHPPIGTGAAPAPEAAAGAPMAGATLPEGSVAQNHALAWTAPAHWQERAPGSIRKGSYTVAGDAGTGDLSITAFPGDTGGLHANVNRWRGQIGLAPVGNAEVEAALEHVDANGLHIDFVDLAGPQGVRLLGAIVPLERETWFFKLTGPDAVLAKERPAFRDFLTTIKTR